MRGRGFEQEAGKAFARAFGTLVFVWFDSGTDQVFCSGHLAGCDVGWASAHAEINTRGKNNMSLINTETERDLSTRKTFAPCGFEQRDFLPAGRYKTAWA